MTTRRDFLNAAATSRSGAIASGAVPVPMASADGYDPEAMAAEILGQALRRRRAGPPGPRDYLAKGLDRTLVLGGGGFGASNAQIRSAAQARLSPRPRTETRMPERRFQCA
jgi:hypothetical protein